MFFHIFFFSNNLVLFEALRDGAPLELDAGGVDAVALVGSRHALALKLQKAKERAFPVQKEWGGDMVKAAKSMTICSVRQSFHPANRESCFF